ncbi:MAG TPA: HAD-IA family hydrolase [Candidatus Xenobia bacterium]|jgi:putative hydrolase of the HAD superfamily
MRYEAIFLDVGGVFQLPTAPAIVEVLATFGVAADASLLQRCHYAGMAAYDRSSGQVEREWWADYLRAYARMAGAGDDPAVPPALLGAFRQSPRWATVIGPSVQALHALLATGVKVAIVSNSDGTVEDRLKLDGTCQVGPGPCAAVHCILDSKVVGISKPDPAIFHLALAKLQAAAARVMHVGDSVRADVVGARAAGIRPLHLDPYGFCPDTDHDHLRGLTDLLDASHGF